MPEQEDLDPALESGERTPEVDAMADIPTNTEVPVPQTEPELDVPLTSVTVKHPDNSCPNAGNVERIPVESHGGFVLLPNVVCQKCWSQGLLVGRSDGGTNGVQAGLGD